MKSNTRDKAAIAGRFKAFRERMLITQRVLGRLIGISREEICFIERARRMPHYSTLREFVTLESRAVPRKPFEWD